MNDKQKELAEAVIEEIIKPVLPANMLEGRALPRQPDRPLRDRRSARRRRAHRPQDHRRHLRRRGAARRRRVLGQGSVEGRPLGRVRGALRREEHRRRGHRARSARCRSRTRSASRSRSTSPSTPKAPGKFPTRRSPSSSTRTSTCGPKGIIRDARPPAPDLPQDRRVRTLRPRRARVHVGSDRQGAGAARGGGDLARRRRGAKGQVHA